MICEESKCFCFFPFKIVDIYYSLRISYPRIKYRRGRPDNVQHRPSGEKRHNVGFPVSSGYNLEVS